MGATTATQAHETFLILRRFGLRGFNSQLRDKKQAEVRIRIGINFNLLGKNEQLVVKPDFDGYFRNLRG